MSAKRAPWAKKSRMRSTLKSDQPTWQNQSYAQNVTGSKRHHHTVMASWMLAPAAMRAGMSAFATSSELHELTT